MLQTRRGIRRQDLRGILLAVKGTSFIMGRKVAIIGAGNVGATVAYTLAVSGNASEIVMIDINQKKAFGEAMDIRQGAPYIAPVDIYSGDYSDARGADIVVVTSGIARRPGQSRLDLAQTNVDITKSIIPQITAVAPNAVYIIVSNPVDILTYTFCKHSGLSEKQIIGTGTILDTARLRSRLAENFHINMQNVHGCVLGEHGDSSFIPWSLVTISGTPVDDYARAKGLDIEGCGFNHEEIETYVKRSGATIIDAKGATYYAVSLSTNHICGCIFRGIDTALPVSTMMNGEYGISDVCLSNLSIIGKGGVNGKLISPMTEEEIMKLRASADTLRGVIASLKI